METTAFGVLWVSLALYAVLAGADFGVGLWVLVARGSERADELRREAFAYFSPLWETNALFLIFFLMGLLTAFSRAVGVLGRALIPLVLAALCLFVVRAGAYTLFHYGPGRLRGAAAAFFGLSSVGAAVLLGYAGAAPASGDITGDTLPLSYYGSAVGLASLPLAFFASAHLGALVLAAHARLRRSDAAEWFRVRGLVCGIAAGVFGALFTLAVLRDAEYTRDRLVGAHGVLLAAAAVLVAAGLVALRARRYGLAVFLTGPGYLTGLVGGAFAQLPYVVYPSLTLEEAASPASSITGFLVATAIGGPLLLVAVGVLYAVTLRPAASDRAT